MKLYLVRHTLVDVPQGICYGQTDVPPADSFESESASVRSGLSDIPFDIVFCSPLTRCTKLGAQLNLRLHLDDRLKELDFGEWEGWSWEKIFESEKGKQWFADYMHNACPNGESYHELLSRVESFIADLPRTHGNVLVITHAGVIRAFMILLKILTREKAFETPIAYGQITVIEINTSTGQIYGAVSGKATDSTKYQHHSC